MAFVAQTFSVAEILTAASMNQVDTNIDAVRSFHLGASAPAALIGGINWIDNTSATWVWKVYDGTDWIEIGEINTSTNQFLPKNGLPTGGVIVWPGSTPPTGTVETDGAEVSITTYENLFDIVTDFYGLDTGATFTVVTGDDTLEDVAHGLSNDDVVWLTTTGTLPAGLAIDTKYYVINKTDDDYQVSLTLSGSAVDITDTGSGTHTWHGSFKLPDYRGEFLRGLDGGAGTDPDAATRTDRGDGTGGDVVGSKQVDAFKSHLHTASFKWTGSKITAGPGAVQYSGSTNTGSTGGNETRPTNVNVIYCIKY